MIQLDNYWLQQRSVIQVYCSHCFSWKRRRLPNVKRSARTWDRVKGRPSHRNPRHQQVGVEPQANRRERADTAVSTSAVAYQGLTLRAFNNLDAVVGHSDIVSCHCLRHCCFTQSCDKTGLCSTWAFSLRSNTDYNYLDISNLNKIQMGVDCEDASAWIRSYRNCNFNRAVCFNLSICINLIEILE